MRKKNNIIIGSLLGVLLLMVVGYAAFNSVLNIKGTSGISSNWNVLITNVVSKNITGGATNAEDPTWDGLTATFKTNLVSPGDSIEYDITVSNKGNLNATLDKITLSDPNNDAIIFTTSGLTEGDTLAAGQSTVLTVKVEYDSSVTTQPKNTTGTLEVTLDYVQEGKEINSPLKNPANVEITSIEPANAVGLASVASEPTYYGLNATLKTNLTNQDDSLEYNITIQNQGDEAATLTGVTVNEENKVATITSSGVTEGETLQGNGTKVMTVRVAKAPSAPTGKVEAEVNVSLEYTASGTTGGNITTDDLISTTVTSGDGLYIDITEEGRYIYKGTEPSNYITFNNETWRIMSIESDGTLKIIRNESIGDMSWDAAGTRDNATSTYCSTQASNNGCNAWAATSNLVGTPSAFTLYYPNGNPNTDTKSYSGTVMQDSSLNTYLNTTYLGSIKEDSKYIVNHNFNVGTPGDYYDKEDIATDVSQEALYKWNGKIGLMNITDVLKTTTNATCTDLVSAYGNISLGKGNCNKNNWMWIKSGYEWTISPNIELYRRSVWLVSYGGFISFNRAVVDSNGVRPVVYLTSEITLSGEGTESNPYTIVS